MSNPVIELVSTISIVFLRTRTTTMMSVRAVRPKRTKAVVLAVRCFRSAYQRPHTFIKNTQISRGDYSILSGIHTPVRISTPTHRCMPLWPIWKIRFDLATATRDGRCNACCHYSAMSKIIRVFSTYSAPVASIRSESKRTNITNTCERAATLLCACTWACFRKSPYCYISV